MTKPKAKPRTKKLPTETLLRNEISNLKRERMFLTDKVADLGGQVEELRKARLISPAEEANFAEISNQFYLMKAEIDTLALWLRLNKATEIAKGLHEGKSISAVVIGYLTEQSDRKEKA